MKRTKFAIVAAIAALILGACGSAGDPMTTRSRTTSTTDAAASSRTAPP